MRKTRTITLIIILLLSTIPTVWALQIERPSLYDANFDKRIENSSTNGEASVGIGVAFNDYNAPPNSWGKDYISMNVSMTGNSRKGLNYTYETYDELYEWMREDWWDTHYKQEFENVGDDWGTWVDLEWSFRFLFYDGKYINDASENASSKVWVCSNGFISFDLSNSTSRYPYSIPNPASPNAIIAPLWTDLTIDNQSKIIIMKSTAPGLTSYLVVIWKNALHKSSGQRLTFAVALKGYSWLDEGQPYLEDGYIYMAYQNVTSINTCFTYGIEDHEGRKGAGRYAYGNELGSLNGKTLLFHQDSPNRFVKRLTLEFEDQNYHNLSYIIRNENDLIRGNNLGTKTYPTPQPDGTRMFLSALGGTGTFLTGYAGYLLSISTFPATWPISLVLVTSSLGSLFAYLQYNSIEYLERKDSNTNPGIQRAYIKAPASSDTVVDASLGVAFEWILGTPYTENHNLTIAATLTYYDYPLSVEKNVTTTANIKLGPDTNNSFDTAYEVHEGTYGIDPMLWLGGYDTQDFYKIYLGNEFIIDIKAYPSGIQDFDLYLYNPNGVQKAKSETRGNAMESINYEVDSAGWWFIETRLVVGIGFYNMSISAEYIGRCPTLFVWNGTDYVYEALLDIHAESDITLQHRITQPLVKDGIFYKLSLRELDEFTSHIDQVRLYAVDSHGEWHICPLVSAIHSEQGWVTLQLRFDDNTRVDLTPTQTINLKFTYLKDDIAYFTFEINGHNRKWPGE